MRWGGAVYLVLHTGQVYVGNVWRGIRGTRVEPSIQDVLDEVAPIKEAPLWVEGRFIQM